MGRLREDWDIITGRDVIRELDAATERARKSPYKVQIVGPMTGYPNYNYDQFDDVAAHLRLKGLPGVAPYSGVRPYQVVNPADNFGRDQTRPRREYIALTLRQVSEADALVLLPDWHQSEGACLEAQMALDLGKDFYVAFKRNEQWEIGATSAETVQNVLTALADKPEPLKRRFEGPGLTDEEYDKWKADFEAAAKGPRAWVFAGNSTPMVSEDGVHFRPDETIEQEAGRLVRNGARQQTYGHPRGDFDRVAGMWSAILGIPLTAENVAIMMIAFKLARLSQTPQHHDTKVDVIGYTVCLDRLQEEA